MRLVQAALPRGLAAFGLWLLLYGRAPAGLVVGIAVAAAAAWTSLRLLPPTSARLRSLALVSMSLHFLWQSLLAGADVAWRALDPRLPLRPGYVPCRLRLPAGPRRSAFLALASLLPGSLPAAVAPDGTVLIHGLDRRQPVGEDFAAAEARFARVRLGD